MTAEELDASLAVVCPHWSADAWAQFREASPADQALALQMLTDAQEPPPVDWTTKALAILEAALQIAGGITGIAGAAESIRSLVKG